ncbi:MAG: HAMP domain-containing sensor histidine kinase [Pseudomonadota bacterium]
MREVLGSLTFRYIAKYVIVLSATVFLLLAVLYALFSRNYFNELGASIVDELDSLQIIYRGQGMQGVEQYIKDSVTRPAFHRFSYLVLDESDMPIAGDLPPDSSYEEFDDGWLAFQMNLLNWGEEIEVDFLARRMPLDSRYRVIVARSYRDAVNQAGLVVLTLLRAMIATVILGVIGGFLSASRTLSQVDQLNIQLQRILRGNPRQRLDADAQKGYVRDLALIVNDTLDQMESLMQGVRNVSDNIAHDLRTPLTRMHNRLSQLRNQLDDEGREGVQSVIEDCDELLSTFNALLRISALESGGQLSDAAQLDLTELLADVVELYEPLAHARGIAINNRVDLPFNINGDVDLLFQMFANLLDNAIKYSPGGRSIAIELQRASGEDQLTVIVADSGPGIPDAERENVFRRFYRLESARSEQPGHGLGLSLARAITQYHGGALELANNKPGLQVRVHLPSSDSGD